MPCSESIEFAFGHLGKAADTVKTAECVEGFPSACENFMCICLVANVPDHFIIGRVKHIMHRNREFNSAKACSQVARVYRNHIDNKLPDFGAKLGQLIDPEFPQIVGVVDMRQERTDCGGHRVLKLRCKGMEKERDEGRKEDRDEDRDEDREEDRFSSRFTLTFYPHVLPSRFTLTFFLTSYRHVLNQSQFHLGFFAQVCNIPGRLEGEFNLHSPHSFNS